MAFLLIDCHRDGDLGPAEPASCTNPGYTRVEEFADVSAQIVAKTVYTTSGTTTNYYIDQPANSPVLSSILWEACNLPTDYKQDKLAVRISGHTLTYPGMNQGHPYAYPLELTKIARQ